MEKIKVRKGQSLMDIAVCYYGSAEGVFDLVRRNKLNGITANVYHGQELETGEPLNVRLSHILPKNIATVTGSRASGIGFWRINKEFILPQTEN